MARLPVLVLITGPLLAAATAATPPAAKVTDAWCRAAPASALAGALAGACYMTLTASGGDRLAAVETPAADHGEIHTMDMSGGVMRMRQLTDGILLPAGQSVDLKPGARHLMIIGPRQPLAAGGGVPLTLRFEKAAPLTLRAPILIAAPPAATGSR